MPPEKSKVQKLNEALYSRTRYKDPGGERSKIEELETPDVSENWQTTGLDEILTRERVNQTGTSFMKKFFIFALIFFVLALGVAGYVFFGGSTFVSSKNVEIVVVGPAIAPAGEVVELEVTVKNGNNANLELANFSVQYPQGLRDSTDSTKPLTFTKESLGVIEAGDENVRNVRFYLVGATGEKKELKFSVEYQVKGSNATFYKDKVYEITIGNSPISLNIETPDSVSSGDRFNTTVSITLNSGEVLKNVMLRAEYPYGFTPRSASPEAISDNNVWALGDLFPGVTKKVIIDGSILGENQDERTFRFYVGAAEGEEPNPAFKSVVMSSQETVRVEKPDVALSVTLNGDRGSTYVVPAGATINTSIRFENNLPERLLNPKVEVGFSGNAFNEGSVVVQNGGFYNSVNDRISWSPTNTSGVSEFGPGESSFVSFNFASLADQPATGNREVVLDISISGTPIGSRQPITIKERRMVRIASQVTLNAKSLYSIGPFSNSGPIPPKAESETTYTVVWSIGNTQNDLTDSKVTAKLGPAVSWLQAHSEESEDISYDPDSNTVTWNLGTLSSGTGFSSELREVSFQVSLTPSLSQVGTAPVLVNSINFSGFETVAQRIFNVSAQNITTRIGSDPKYIQGDEIVVR